MWMRCRFWKLPHCQAFHYLVTDSWRIPLTRPDWRCIFFCFPFYECAVAGRNEAKQQVFLSLFRSVSWMNMQTQSQELRALHCSMHLNHGSRIYCQIHYTIDHLCGELWTRKLGFWWLPLWPPTVSKTSGPHFLYFLKVVALYNFSSLFLL